MRIKSLVVATLAAGVAIAVTGCEPTSSPQSAPATTPASRNAQPSGQATPGQTTQAGQPGQDAPAATPSDTHAPDSTAPTAAPQGGTTPAKCTTSQLVLDKGVGGPVGGDWFLRFINVSSTSCVMQGFPGVSQTLGAAGDGVSQTLGAAGDPVGEPADRDQGPQAPKPVPVTLAPNGAAQFEFITYPKQVNACAALRTNTLRVYPPDNTESLSLPWDSLICPSPQRMLIVRAVQPM
ncbi:DUF4232 domain-containing protein [Nocardia sp. CA-151230]|uniref:DUF4232 domain-containing protein n=1 Tax=Nocardia sp. CA-151230 TaxID=3239982 RepID=UPI003D8EBADF